MNLRQRIAEFGAQAFGLDARSLAVFRIAVGAVLLTDLWVRAGDLSAMYSDAGLAPVELVRRLKQPGMWSLHLASGAAAFQAGLFVLAAVFAAALAVGYRTRAATIASWFLLASLHVRLPVVLNAGDTMLRVLLFWSMFLPLGDAWSLDARKRGSPAPRIVASPASAAFVLQLALVYWFAGLAKWNVAWLSGDALAQILSFQFYGQPLGRRLLEYPELTRRLGAGVVWLELVGPCLLFLPWATASVRVAVVAAFVAFHLGIAATITVGLFPWVGIAAWTAIVPGVFWDRLMPNRATRTSEASRVHPFAAIGCAAAIAVVAYWNVADLTGVRLPERGHGAVRGVANLTMLRQSWRVFGEPMRFDARFVYRGRLASGELVDLFTGERLSHAQDAGLAPQDLPNHRWRKLHLWITRPAFAAYRRPLAEYVCRRWNGQHAGRDQAVRLDFFCFRRRLERGSDAGDFVRVNLATVVLDASADNFSEALRELGE